MDIKRRILHAANLKKFDYQLESHFAPLNRVRLVPPETADVSIQTEDDFSDQDGVIFHKTIEISLSLVICTCLVGINFDFCLVEWRGV